MRNEPSAPRDLPSTPEELVAEIRAAEERAAIDEEAVRLARAITDGMRRCGVQFWSEEIVEEAIVEVFGGSTDRARLVLAKVEAGMERRRDG